MIYIAVERGGRGGEGREGSSIWNIVDGILIVVEALLTNLAVLINKAQRSAGTVYTAIEDLLAESSR